MSKIKAFLDNPEYFITSPAAKGYLDWIPDEIYLKLLYRAKMKERCNLKNPVLYNEKLQWLKLHDRKPEYQQMVDKYEVRSFITEKLGEDYLIPCYGVFEKWEDIDFEKLPDQFVIKCTHDSGSVEICTDKATWDKESAKQRIKDAMKRNYYKTYREWPYKNTIPRIVIEKYMVDESGDDLKDYKIMCFNGKAKIVEVHENRFTQGKVHTQTFYTKDWEKLEIEQEGCGPVKASTKKPDCLDKMLELSEVIAKDMIHVRVDWYLINGRIYFGEITFYDGSGFERFNKKEYDKMLGDLIELK